jgi:two-component system sensor histidine kinase AlgZ
MHPILAHRGRLGLYLLSWTPLAPLIALLLHGRAGGGWAEALALALPLTVVYAYLCLAAWYVCKSAPLAGRTPGSRIEPLVLQAAGAALSSGVWVALGWGWAAALGLLPAFAGARVRFESAMPQLFAAGAPIYLLAATVHYLLPVLERAGEAERRALELEVEAREAELRALRAQLDPHFLFNSLNTVAALAGSDPAAARRVAILLAEFLRRSLQLGARRDIPLADELAHAASYLAVERVRFGERLRVEEEIDEASRGCLMPPLILQPLLENAVRHGIAQLLEGGAIRIAARRRGERLELAVENPCDPDHPPGRGDGVGLANVAARLAAAYGPSAALRVAESAGSFRVEVSLPAAERTTGGAEDGRG